MGIYSSEKTSTSSHFYHLQHTTRNTMTIKESPVKSILFSPITHDRMKYHIEKALGKLFPEEANRLYLSFIYPLISPVTVLIKQSHHVGV